MKDVSIILIQNNLNEDKIIVFANYAYKDILELWLRYISNFDLEKYPNHCIR